MLTVQQAAERLEVSPATVWRMLRRGALPSVKTRGRRLIPTSAVKSQRKASDDCKLEDIPPLTFDDPLWELIGAYKGPLNGPGSEDKYGALFDDDE